MKYRSNWFYRKINGVQEKYYCIEYNDSDIDDDTEWYELEDLTEDMCKDIAELLNKKYSTSPYYIYNKVKV
jgi:hypothetical protein